MSIAPHGAGSAVRVAFHRTIAKPSGEAVVIWAEEMREPEPYARFFQQLAGALATSSRSPAPAPPAR